MTPQDLLEEAQRCVEDAHRERDAELAMRHWDLAALWIALAQNALNPLPCNPRQ